MAHKGGGSKIRHASKIRHMSNEIASCLLTVCMNLKLSHNGEHNNDDITIHVGRPVLLEKKGRI